MVDYDSGKFKVRSFKESDTIDIFKSQPTVLNTMVDCVDWKVG